MFISALNLAEIEKGTYKMTSPPAQASRHASLTLWLGKVTARLAQRTLPVNAAVWRTWAQQSAVSQRQGQTLPPKDSLTMATAQSRGLTLVIRNTAVFVRYLQVLNPRALA